MTTVLLALFGAIVLGESARPAVDRLSARVARPAAIALVFAAIFAALFTVVAIPVRWLIPQFLALWASLPAYLASAERLARQTPDLQSRVAPLAAALARDPLGLGSALSTAVPALVLSLFWLGASTPLAAFVVNLLPADRRAEAASIFQEMGTKLGAYVGGTVVNGSIVAAVSILTFLALKVPHAVVLGIVAGALMAIPYLGTMIGMTAVFVVAFAAQGWLAAAEASALTALIQTLEGSFVAPLIFKQYVDVDPFGCVLASMIGGALFGIPGVVLAVPAASVVKTAAVRVLAPMVTRRNAAILALVALLAFGRAASCSADTKLSGDEILARTARTGSVQSYSVPVHFDVHLRRPIGAKGAVEGVVYFQAPAQAVLAITKAPPVIGDFFRGSYNLDMVPQTWPAKYHVTAVTTDVLGATPVYVLHAELKSPGTIDAIDFHIAQADFSPLSVEWLYHDKSSIRLSFTNQQVGDLTLPRTATIRVDMPRYGLDGDAAYGTYAIGDAIPPGVFKTK